MTRLHPHTTSIDQILIARGNRVAARTIVFCFDRSRSFPDILIDKTVSQTVGTAAELVDETSAAAGSPPTTVYVSLTGRD